MYFYKVHACTFIFFACTFIMHTNIQLFIIENFKHISEVERIV